MWGGHTWSRCFQNISQMVVKEYLCFFYSCSWWKMLVHIFKCFQKFWRFSWQLPCDVCNFHCPDFLESRRVVFLCIFWLTGYIFDPLSTERFNFQLSNKYIFKINFISKSRHARQNEMRSAGRMLWRDLLNGLILFYSHISHKYANYSPGTK